VKIFGSDSTNFPLIMQANARMMPPLCLGLSQHIDQEAYRWIAAKVSRTGENFIHMDDRLHRFRQGQNLFQDGDRENYRV
jgi:hypothetical protein